MAASAVFLFACQIPRSKSQVPTHPNFQIPKQSSNPKAPSQLLTPKRSPNRPSQRLAPTPTPNVPASSDRRPTPNVPANSVILDPSYPNTLYVGTDVGVFARYENFDTQFRMPEGFTPLEEFDRTAWIAGFALLQGFVAVMFFTWRPLF